MRLLDRLPRRRRQHLGELQRAGLGAGVVVGLHRDLRRAGLAVPAHELGEVAAGGVGEAGDEILDRRGLAVMALEIEVHAGAELVRRRAGS